MRLLETHQMRRRAGKVDRTGHTQRATRQPLAAERATVSGLPRVGRHLLAALVKHAPASVSRQGRVVRLSRPRIRGMRLKGRRRARTGRGGNAQGARRRARKLPASTTRTSLHGGKSDPRLSRSNKFSRSNHFISHQRNDHEMPHRVRYRTIEIGDDHMIDNRTAPRRLLPASQG